MIGDAGPCSNQDLKYQAPGHLLRRSQPDRPHPDPSDDLLHTLAGRPDAEVVTPSPHTEPGDLHLSETGTSGGWCIEVLLSLRGWPACLLGLWVVRSGRIRSNWNNEWNNGGPTLAGAVPRLQRQNAKRLTRSPPGLLAQRSPFRRLRQCRVGTHEHVGEVTIPDLDRGGSELAQQRVGGLAGERAHVEGVQLRPAGPE
jgi:hypothetical protein